MEKSHWRRDTTVSLIPLGRLVGLRDHLFAVYACPFVRRDVVHAGMRILDTEKGSTKGMDCFQCVSRPTDNVIVE